MADVDAASLVVKRLGPWNRARCSCINRVWKQAVDKICFPDASNQHWLVQADGALRLSMTNLVSGREQVVELNLPWDSIPLFRDAKDTRSRVLCSFRGLVLISLDDTLVLGDPLLNKWIKLPEWDVDVYGFISTCAFCPTTCTLMATGIYADRTATFDLATAEWEMAGVLTGGSPVSRACCLGGVFYTIIDSIPPCYDPANHPRRWRSVGKKFVKPYVYYVAQLSQDKMLLYMRADGGENRMFEASGLKWRSGEREIVPWDGLERTIGCPVWPGYNGLSRTRQVPLDGLHGQDGMLFWEGFDNRQDKMTDDKEVKEFKCTRANSSVPPDKVYYAPAPGTADMLNELEEKIMSKCQRGGRSPGREPLSSLDLERLFRELELS